MTQSLSILCFGDSLTAGFYHHGLEYHPYAKKLYECLQTAFPTPNLWRWMELQETWSHLLPGHFYPGFRGNA
jgi:hypothetical protein